VVDRPDDLGSGRKLGDWQRLSLRSRDEAKSSTSYGQRNRGEDNPFLELR
jgi:hypothetical protein